MSWRLLGVAHDVARGAAHPCRSRPLQHYPPLILAVLRRAQLGCHAAYELLVRVVALVLLLDDKVRRRAALEVAACHAARMHHAALCVPCPDRLPMPSAAVRLPPSCFALSGSTIAPLAPAALAISVGALSNRVPIIPDVLSSTSLDIATNTLVYF